MAAQNDGFARIRKIEPMKSENPPAILYLHACRRARAVAAERREDGI